MQEEDLQERVNNVVEDEQQDTSNTDNENDTGGEDSDVENDDNQEADKQSDSQDRQQAASSQSAPPEGEEDDGAEEDDVDELAYRRPDFTQGSQQAEQFDIRSVPRDPETGLIDPEKANQMAADFYRKQAEQRDAVSGKVEENRQLLMSQWQMVTDRLPHIAKSRDLREMARDIHLNSIGSSNYLTPWQAAMKVDRLYKKAVKSGIKQGRSKRTVETMVRTQSGGGKSVTTDNSPYEQAKKLALSSDPTKARQGRMEIMRLRRLARQRQ